MAIRNTLHKNQLAAFSTWLLTDGWSLERANGNYEVLRARKGNRLLLIYSGNSGDHYRYADKFHGVVRAFQRDMKTKEETEQ